MAGRQTVFNAIDSNQTVELHQFPGLEPTAIAGSILLEFTGSNQSDVDIEIQGKIHEDGEYNNLDYVEIFIEGAEELTKRHVHVESVEHRYYLIPYPPPLVQLKALFKRGTLTTFVSFVTSPFNVDVSSGRMIELLELILQASNASLINQIGTAEILTGVCAQLAHITGVSIPDGE